MSSESHNTAHAEVIRSPALYQGEIEVAESAGSAGARFSGTRLKNRFIPAFLWLVRHTPPFIALLPARAVAGLARIAYPLSNNPLRRSCAALCELTEGGDRGDAPRRLYRRFLGNFIAVLGNYIDLYRGGAERVAERIHIPAEDAERIEALRREHEGVFLAVPHNLASAFSALKLNRTWPTLLVARNSATVARTRVALTFFERMQVKILMVRGGNPVELSRAIISALKDHQVVAATLDNISSQKNRIDADIFGQRVGFPAWAAKIAAKRRVPMVPVYFASAGQSVEARFGEPLVSDNPEELVQHYVDFFAASILHDPASWAYLADKRWRRVLEQARAAPPQDREPAR